VLGQVSLPRGELTTAVAAHAHAVDAGDPVALEQVLHRFVDTDQLLLAAETAVQAAADSPEGARLTALGATLRQLCPRGGNATAA